MQTTMFKLAGACALAWLTCSTSAWAQSQRAPTSDAVTPAMPRWQPRMAPAAAPTTSAAPPSTQDRDEDALAAKRRREAWLLSLEAVTHAPVDVGVQLGVETPPGIRLFGGYGWVPHAYMNLLTGVAAAASGNSYAQALLEQADYSGHTWRVQIGWRPFRAIGLYGDVGYARLRAKGSLDLSDTNEPRLAALGGGYRADTKLDMWLVELGYQGQLAERMVLGLALGAMGTFDATTTISAVDGAPRSKLLDDAGQQGDAALESYGIVPTLTLRLGVDLI